MAEFAKWFADSAEFLRYNYDLNESSIVVDVGVYKGEFIKNITNKYNCFVYGFEPVPDFYNEANNLFQNNNKVKIFNYGLGNNNCELDISLEGDSSSIYKRSTNNIPIQIRSIKDVVEELNILQVDLIKINIEGGEYSLIDFMIIENIINKFKNIQVQFHDFIPNAEMKRNAIRNRLTKTHRETFCYDFVWENHVRID